VLPRNGKLPLSFIKPIEKDLFPFSIFGACVRLVPTDFQYLCVYYTIKSYCMYDLYFNRSSD
jgi:hypothetical protein